MTEHFNKLLLQTLEDVRDGLKRLENRTDVIAKEKADKSGLEATHKRLDRIDDKLDPKAEKSDLAEVKTELKTDVAELKTELKTDVAELKTELKTDIAELKTELKADVAATNKRLDNIENKLDQKADKSDLAELRTELKADGIELKSYIDEVKTELKADIAELKADGAELREEVVSLRQRFDHIAGGIGILKWVLPVEIAAVGVILALMRSC